MHITALLLVLLMALTRAAGAQPYGGYGARAEGMGGAFVAVADDATAVYWNPAGIATGSTVDLHVSRSDETNIFVGLALPVLAFSYYRTEYPLAASGLPTVSPPPDRQNDGAGSVRSPAFRAGSFGVTAVQTVASGLVIGTTTRIIRGGVEGAASRTTVDFDAGAMWSAGPVRVGAAGRNLREPEFEHEQGETRMKRQWRIGAAVAPRSLPTGVHGPFTLAFDADATRTPSPEGDVRRAAVGGEAWLLKGKVGVRAGTRWSTLDDGYRALSAGLTVGLPRSVFLEGQMTNPNDSERTLWNASVRLTF